MRGRFLRLFIGNMASGKTRHLLTEIDTLRKYGNKKIAVFKPRTDTRSGMNYIKSRKGDEDAAEEISVTAPKEMWAMLRAKESGSGCRFQVIAFDEVQCRIFVEMVRDGRTVAKSGPFLGRVPYSLTEMTTASGRYTVFRDAARQAIDEMARTLPVGAR